MSKKLPLSIALAFLGLGAFAQTIVGTTPENRNVVLEEFTGINCVFCPQGHAIAQQLKDDNPGDVFLVNIHSGGFAAPGAGQPDFRTQWGAAIDAQSELAGYPAGTVNRQNFPGQEQGNAGATAIGRGEWVSAATQVLGESSYVNVGVEAELDVSTGVMTIDVEAYYTADSPEATNKFNVAILQNNTTGPQTGGNMGDNYNHQHRLIDLATGQWGEDITSTTASSLYSNTFSYTVPADVNGIPVELGELEVVVFVTETTQYLVSGSGTTPTITGLDNANDANLRTVADLPDTCLGVVSPSVNVQNLGQNEITSLDITYDINGGTAEVYTWTGSLTSLQSTDIELPEISFPNAASYTLNVSIPTDDVTTNNEVTGSFEASVETVGTMKLTVITDDWAEEASWSFVGSDGTVLETGSYTATADDQTTFEYSFNFGDDCITFNMVDSYGDGLTTGGNGGVELKDANDVIVYALNADYGAGFSIQFDSDGVLGLGDNDLSEVSIFPNPANTVLNISNADNATVEVFNVLGQVMMTRSNISVNETLDVSNLAIGTYLVKINDGVSVSTKKFVIAR